MASIIGVGQSRYSWAAGVHEIELAAAAIREAVADAGVALREIDGFACFSGDEARPAELVQKLGTGHLRVSLECAGGPASAVGMLAAAVAAVESKQARLVVCYRAFNGRSRIRLGHLPLPPQSPDGHVPARGNGPFGGEFTGPYGVVSPACLFPLWVNAYLARHGLARGALENALCRIVVRQRAHASNNPHALLRDRPLDAEAYRSSAIVAEPLRRVDFCLESDGACAYVVGTEGHSAVRPRAVRVLGTSQALLPGYERFFLDASELPPRADRTLLPRLLESAGCTHADVDVLGLYDACAANILFDLETLGFCAEGAAVDFVRRDRPAVNTSGGMLAEVYLQGANQVVEVVRQLRGESANQLEHARLGVVSTAAVQSVALLAAPETS